ncbi:MAG: extracellular solute-binding protein [Chloroflexi bacterium]|nr:extracellular solute-binding protein [Chloroflexota bacterium]
MSIYRKCWSFASVIIALLVCVACVAPPAAPGASSAAPASGGETEIISWYYYDQNNTDPQANERVGNFYLAKTIPLFNEQFKGKYTWSNVPHDYNLALDLVTAVQNKGDIPDVMRMGASDLPTFIVNNTVQDLTDFIKSAPWYSELDPKALTACTGPDGKLYCVPISESPYVVFYWSDLYPNGFPKTTDEFLKEAAALKSQGKYALTYWGSTAFDGEAAGRYYFQVLSSFGGGYDDGKGSMLLNTPENIKAVEFMREIVTKGYSSESVFVGNFEEEAAFKDAEAGAFPTGFFVAYQYLNPLTSPKGTAYKSATAKDMEDAVKAGEIKIAPSFAPEGKQPGCHNDVFGFVIPNGAKNPEGAKAYINWVMDPTNGVDWVLNAGGGLPVAKSMLSNAAFQTEVFKQGATAGAASDCRAWYGSLLKIPEAKKIIATTLFDLIKSNPTADIAAALTKAQDEYNKNK